MAKARNNRQFVDPSLDLDTRDLQVGEEQYSDWHWGLPPRRVVDWDDPDMPRSLIECGRLVRMHVRAPKKHRPVKHPRRDRDTMIEFSHAVSENSHIAYDPDHADERLYLLVDPRASATLKKRFWDENEFRPMPLSEVAMLAGGRHGKRPDYPHVAVKPIGVLTAVVYYTAKKGDTDAQGNGSYYIHRMAELSGHFPFLCADNKGRLWLAGGNYTAPTPGITD